MAELNDSNSKEFSDPQSLRIIFPWPLLISIKLLKKEIGTHSYAKLRFHLFYSLNGFATNAIWVHCLQTPTLS